MNFVGGSQAAVIITSCKGEACVAEFRHDNPSKENWPSVYRLKAAAALEKVHTHSTEDGTPVHSLRTLIAELATLVRDTCRTPGAADQQRCLTLDEGPRPSDRQDSQGTAS
jgi:hypothetical protein